MYMMLKVLWCLSHSSIDVQVEVSFELLLEEGVL